MSQNFSASQASERTAGAAASPAQKQLHNSHSSQVLVFLDVDGVVSHLPCQRNPWAGTPHAVVPAGYGMNWLIHQPVVDAIKRWGAHSAVQLIWISAWEEAAEQINHTLELMNPTPWLPITNPFGAKTPSILEYLSRNPGYTHAVAVDDEFTAADVQLLQDNQVHTFAPAITGLNQEIISAIDSLIEEVWKEGNWERE